MVQKHTEHGQLLASLAQRSGVTDDEELSSEEQRTYARLASLPENEFDQSFKQTVDSGHVKELAMYQDEVGRAQDPQLRALAERRVAALQKSVANADKPRSAKSKGEW